eukprot:scaffold166986_cov27-Prasinocladus_malaysianus.AAC.2
MRSRRSDENFEPTFIAFVLVPMKLSYLYSHRCYPVVSKYPAAIIEPTSNPHDGSKYARANNHGFQLGVKNAAEANVDRASLISQTTDKPFMNFCGSQHH